VSQVRGLTVSEAVRDAAVVLEAAGCGTPRLDAELLVACALSTDRAGLVRLGSDALDDPASVRVRELIARRSLREPVAQITGRRWFRNLELEVNRHVLSPRPETELLVEWGLTLSNGARVVDVGTGSGAIALALADERPDLCITATDIDPDALSTAKANGARLGMKVEFELGDLLAPIEGPIDAVVSNPPYIPEADLAGLEPEVREFEPRIALTPGPDGLEVVERLLKQAASRGVEQIAIEIGAGQADAAAELMRANGWVDVAVTPDLAGIGRMVAARARVVPKS
jgi:release factor glutamine methyltransferase